MESRPSRSMSIPIPSARGPTTLPPLDDFISMPFTASPLPLPRLPDLERPSVGRPPVLPRIIGRNTANAAAMGPSTSWADIACSPPSPARARRSSVGTGTLSYRPTPSSVHPIRSPTANAHWRPRSQSQTMPNLQTPTQPTPPQPFPRPDYLNHSALRDLLQTEIPPHLHQQLQLPPPTTHVRLFTPVSDSEDERSPSPPRRTPTGPGLALATRGEAMVGNKPIFRLPTRWSEQDRHIFLSVSSDGRELTYNGTSFPSNSTIDNAGLARANHPIPPACGIYYYEVEVLSKGQKSQISIGFTSSENHLNKLPGWEKRSWGYHGDDGVAYAGDKNGSQYGPTFGSGDIIGAGIDFSKNRAFFTKNGTLIGPVFEKVGVSPMQLFPSVGLRHAHEHIRVNFGHQPFRFDIDEHVQGQRDAVWTEIQSAPVDWRVLAPLRTAQTTDADGDDAMERDAVGGRDSDELGTRGRDTLGQLVLGYLVHHGYAKSAQAFEAQLAVVPVSPPALPVPPPTSAVPSLTLDGADSPMPDAASTPTPADPAAGSPADALGRERRLAVLRAVHAGELDAALTHTEAWFPDVLRANDGFVRLQLRCRKFVELVNGAAETKRRLEVMRAGKEREAMGVDVDGMDVDDGAGTTATEEARERGSAEAALRAAIAYGQRLRAEYKRDTRREVQALLERTFAVVAYHFPMAERGEIGRWAGREGRESLAEEVNAAILQSQGYPARPELERVYRQAAASVAQLGYLGVGSAVFADVRRELLEG